MAFSSAVFGTNPARRRSRCRGGSVARQRDVPPHASAGRGGAELPRATGSAPPLPVEIRGGTSAARTEPPLQLGRQRTDTNGIQFSGLWDESRADDPVVEAALSRGSATCRLTPPRAVVGRSFRAPPAPRRRCPRRSEAARPLRGQSRLYNLGFSARDSSQRGRNLTSALIPHCGNEVTHRWTFNANGVPSSSPGLARGTRAYPGCFGQTRRTLVCRKAGRRHGPWRIVRRSVEPRAAGSGHRGLRPPIPSKAHRRPARRRGRRWEKRE